MGLGESPQGDQMEDLPVKNGGLMVENHRKTIGKLWFNGGLMVENHRKTIGKP